ncbi:MAG: hypothetical protein P1V51_11160 [Deltaproteobacteria bacterium]|nr:hypothetical protein [Deltaproteobacteria bacterium]
MSGERDEHRDPSSGEQERGGYLKVALVFLISCLLAAGAVALYDAGGPSALFGPRLEEFEAGPPPEGAESESEPAPPTRPRRVSRPGKPVPGRQVSERPAADPAGEAGEAAAPAVIGDPAALGNGQLVVRCSQPCRVTVDGAIVGEAKPVLHLVQPAGDHTVRVEELDGDDLATRKIIVAPNREREVSFLLGSKPPVKDFFKDIEGTEEWER